MASSSKKDYECTPDEKQVFDLIEKGCTEAIKAHIKTNNVKIDCLDPKGMTPLQLAAFRGNPELVEFLLANGADVNSNYHENSYSTLMFAALSGNKEVTRQVLSAGANTNHINSVNRTAAQMAAFVGQHQCVSVINNFFPREEIDYYTKPQGLETEAKLPASVAPALCALINFTNLHPVKISYYLREHPEIVRESKKVCLVFSRLTEKNMKSREINDVMAIKCHFISTVIRLATECADKDKNKSLQPWIKSLVKGRESDGCFELQERLIRQSLKDFPYVNSALLQQLVRQIAPVQIGGDPTAMSLITSVVTGQQFSFDADESCDTCGDPKAPNKCSKCKMVRYCNQDCQRLHWSTHKKFCAQLAEDYKQFEERKKKEEEEKKKQEEEEAAAKKKAEEEATKLTESGDEAAKSTDLTNSEEYPNTLESRDSETTATAKELTPANDGSEKENERPEALES